MELDNLKQFVGKEVKLLTTETKYKEHIFVDYEVDASDQIVQELYTLAGDNLRILPPNTVNTCDYNPTRVNVVVNETGKICNIYLG